MRRDRQTVQSTEKLALFANQIVGACTKAVYALFFAPFVAASQVYREVFRLHALNEFYQGDGKNCHYQKNCGIITFTRDNWVSPKLLRTKVASPPLDLGRRQMAIRRRLSRRPM